MPAPQPPAWLEALPGLPLERGCPVVHSSGLWTATAWQESDLPGCWVILAERGGLEEWHPRHLRLDLAAPLGMAHALRLVAQRFDATGSDSEVVTEVCSPEFFIRHLLGETTDADRLAVARALREVASE